MDKQLSSILKYFIVQVLATSRVHGSKPQTSDNQSMVGSFPRMDRINSRSRREFLARHSARNIFWFQHTCLLFRLPIISKPIILCSITVPFRNPCKCGNKQQFYYEFSNWRNVFLVNLVKSKSFPRWMCI